jgi:hypothetical protein
MVADHFWCALGEGLKLFQLEGLVVFVPDYTSYSLAIVTDFSKLSWDLFEKLEIVLSVGSRDYHFISIQTVLSFAERYRFNLDHFFLVIVIPFIVYFLVYIVDESPFFQKFMYAYNRARISRQTPACLWCIDVLVLADLNDIVAIFFIELLMLLEFNITLNGKKITIVARIPFFILNHSGNAFF